YHYRYASGREGDAPRIGFSPRKANLVLYLTPSAEGWQDLLDRLGKAKTSVACLYINKLADVDLAVLRRMIVLSVEDMRRRYPEGEASVYKCRRLPVHRLDQGPRLVPQGVLVGVAAGRGVDDVDHLLFEPIPDDRQIGAALGVARDDQVAG